MGTCLRSCGLSEKDTSRPPNDDRILKRLDDDGEVIGFLVHEMSTLTEPSPAEFELESEAPADDVANVTVREAAARLGVSERRVRKLALDGRIRGATKSGAEWLIPGKRGPVGVAGRVDFEGYTVPARSKVIVGNTVAHKLPQYFPNPERFDIERFVYT